jgi:GNAT superfamily N-acetyltransferase
MPSPPNKTIPIQKLFHVGARDAPAWSQQANPQVSLADLLALYNSVGWSAYTDKPTTLARAVAGSSYVVGAVDEGRLVGLARAISDDASIFYLQDILVYPDHQRRGIAGRLLRDCLERYGHVRQCVLLTGDDEETRAFYESVGYKETRDLEHGTRCFVQFRAH